MKEDKFLSRHPWSNPKEKNKINGFLPIENVKIKF